MTIDHGLLVLVTVLGLAIVAGTLVVVALAVLA